MNSSCETAVPDDRLTPLFQNLYPALERKIIEVPDIQTEQHKRPQTEILEEVVTGIRNLDSRFRDVERAYSEQSASYDRRHMRFHPAMIDDIMFTASGNSDDFSTTLLVLAGLLREDFPWLYEFFIDASRELRNGDVKTAHRTIERLLAVVNSKVHRRFSSYNNNSKETHMLFIELPMILKLFLHSFESKSFADTNDLPSNDLEDESELQNSEDNSPSIRRYRARHGQ